MYLGIVVNKMKTYLMTQGQHSMTECLGIKIPKYVCLAKVYKRIRYDRLVEGRYCKNVV